MCREELSLGEPENQEYKLSTKGAGGVRGFEPVTLREERSASVFSRVWGVCLLIHPVNVCLELAVLQGTSSARK